MDIIIEKMKCNKCGEEKTPNKFPKRKADKRCNSCVNEYKRAYYSANKEEINRRCRELSPSRRKQKAIYNSRYYNSHKEESHKTSRRYVLKNTYGMSEDDRDNLINKQEGRCAICKKFAELVIDHDHSTQKVRGMLCRKCNLAIGHFEDDITYMASAIKYLSRHLS